MYSTADSLIQNLQILTQELFRVVMELFIHYFIGNMDFAIKYGFTGFFYFYYFLVSTFYITVRVVTLLERPQGALEVGDQGESRKPPLL